MYYCTVVPLCGSAHRKDVDAAGRGLFAPKGGDSKSTDNYHTTTTVLCTCPEGLKVKRALEDKNGRVPNNLHQQSSGRARCSTSYPNNYYYYY